VESPDVLYDGVLPGLEKTGPYMRQLGGLRNGNWVFC